MRREILASLLLLILFFPCCEKEKWEGKILTEQGVTLIENRGEGLWAKEGKEMVTITDDLTLGVEEGEDYRMFYRLRDVAVDIDLNIYILDGGNHRLLKFDKDGNFIWQTGRKGQGPGEFQQPGKVVISPELEIAVIDNRLIHVFDTQGEFQRTILIEKSFRNVAFFPDGRLFVNISPMGQPGVTAEYYSKEGEFLEKFSDEYRYGPKMSPRLGASIGGGYFQLVDEKVYLSIPDQYEIREYDLEGNILRKIKRDVIFKPPNIEVTSSGRGVSVRPSDSSGPCFLYQNEILINCHQLVEKKSEKEYISEKFLDFFNQKGQFLGSHKLPENYRLNTLDSEFKLYFIQWNPFPRVIRSILDIK